MTRTTASSYDELPYESQFNPLTHPDRVAAMASLFGLESPPVEGCRVLELGCGVGGNVIGMAQSLPGATFVGVDLSPRQIADGRGVVRELGLSNVRLEAMSLTDVDDAFGTFDYILCHGVYSWVPEAVRARILEIGARNLVPAGVVFVSYNVYPGWYQRGAVRAALRFHTRDTADPLLRVARARAFLDFLQASTVPPNTPYALALKQEADHLKKARDAYVFHEHLEEDNHPVHFHEFVARAEGAGLRYLAPAQFGLPEATVSPDILERLDAFAGSDRIGREQYLDLVLNRAFRQSLLCRADAPARDEPSTAAIPALRFTALARPESTSPDLVTDADESFQTMSGDRLAVSHRRMKATIAALYHRWPLSAGFEDLRRATLPEPQRDDATPEADADRREFAAMVLGGVMSALIEPHVHEPEIASGPGQRPRTTPLARRQAATDATVINLRNAFASLRDLDRLIVPLLDGTRDRAAVVAELNALSARGVLRLNREGRPVTEPVAVRALLNEQVGASFDRLAGEALFLRD